MSFFINTDIFQFYVFYKVNPSFITDLVFSYGPRDISHCESVCLYYISHCESVCPLLCKRMLPSSKILGKFTNIHSSISSQMIQFTFFSFLTLTFIFKVKHLFQLRKSYKGQKHYYFALIEVVY